MKDVDIVWWAQGRHTPADITRACLLSVCELPVVALCKNKKKHVVFAIEPDDLRQNLAFITLIISLHVSIFNLSHISQIVAHLIYQRVKLTFQYRNIICVFAEIGLEHKKVKM